MSSHSAVSSTASESTLWNIYFETRPPNDSMFFDEQGYVSRLLDLSPHLFSASTDIEFIESSVGADKTDKISIRDEASLSAHLETAPYPTFKIISLIQPFSRRPLNISGTGASKIFIHHNIPPGFLDILCGFGEKEASADDGAASGVYSSFDKSSHDIFYQFWYVERNNRKHGDPWSTRQTGIYHRFSSRHATRAENLWMLVHPMPNSKAQTRLAVAVEKLRAEEMADNPLRLHVLLMSCYIDNWRWYLHDVKRQYTTYETTLTTADLEDTLKEDRGLNFRTLQNIRNLNAKLIPIPNMINSLLSTLSSIKDMNDKLGSQGEFAETSYHLASYSSRLQSYFATAEVLQRRIQNMTKFLADALNVKNQEIAVANQKIAARHQEIAAENQKLAADSNKSLVKLTRDTVDDSSTVKTITMITLVYLPASFISGLFGMNLFKFDDSWAFDMSPQIWIYVVAVIVVMIITYTAWKISVYYQKRKKKEKEKAAKLEDPV